MPRFRKINRNEAPPSTRPRKGLDRWECKEHGFLVDALQAPGTRAWCPCGRAGQITYHGPRRADS